MQEDFVSIRVIGKGSYGQARRADGLLAADLLRLPHVRVSQRLQHGLTHGAPPQLVRLRGDGLDKQRARELAAEGSEDRLGLALTSYGWEANALSRLGRDRDMVARYVVQASLGDPSAVASLRQVMQGVRTRNPDAVFTDALLRDVQTAAIVSHGHVGHVADQPNALVRDWLTGLERHGVRELSRQIRDTMRVMSRFWRDSPHL